MPRAVLEAGGDDAPLAWSRMADGIVLFDGHCVLCSGWFRFVARRDPGIRFRFVAVQQPHGRRLAEQLGIDPDAPRTNAVVVGGRAFLRSDAAIELLRRLPGWRWTILLRVVPRPVRDRCYDLVARNRYTWFGRTEHCMVPTPELRSHLLAEDHDA